MYVSWDLRIGGNRAQLSTVHFTKYKTLKKSSTKHHMDCRPTSVQVEFNIKWHIDVNFDFQFFGFLTLFQAKHKFAINLI